jgi:hypothetical protein
MKCRNRNQDTLHRAQLTKAAIDAFNLKPTDLVKTPVAAGVLGKHEVTLRAWRCAHRGPPFFRDPDGVSVLYRVADLWNWCDRCTVEPTSVRNSQNDRPEAAGAK